MGGQVGDRGTLQSETETVEIFDVKRENNLPIHLTKKLPANPAAAFHATVDAEARHASEANHTATHLLDQALREVLELGEDVDFLPDEDGKVQSNVTSQIPLTHKNIRGREYYKKDKQ